MNGLVWRILMIFLVASASGKSKSNAVRCNKPGVASETIILSKLDSVLHQFQVLQQEVQEQRSSIKENQDQMKNTLELLAKIQQELQQRHTEYQEAITDIRDTLADDIPQKLNDFKPEFSKQREEAKSNQLATENRMEQLQHEIKDMRSLLLINPGLYRSCKDVQTKASGVYNIRGKDILDSFVAYCEQDKHGGGWMVIQQRFNGSLSFNRDWEDFRNGFGDVGGEQWLGLEKVYQFTKEHNCELLVEMKDFNNTYKYARYNSFGIESEAEHFRLNTLGAYSGTAGDALTHHKGMKFSTADRDNDRDDRNNCATYYNGGWWFNSCYFAFLNGFYQNVSGKNMKHIVWYGFTNDLRGLSYTRMMIRPLK